MLRKINYKNIYYKLNDIPTIYDYIFRNKTISKSKYHYNNFVSIMTLLYKRYRTSKNYGTSFDEVFVYLKPNYYTKKFINTIKDETSNINNWKQFVKTNKLTYTNTINILKVLEDLNIITIKKGFKKFGKIDKKNYKVISSEITRIKLTSPDEWNLSNFIKPNDDLFLFFGELYDIRTLPRKNKKYSAVYKNKKNRVPCEKSIRNEVDYINKTLYKDQYKIFNYQRIFGKNKEDYGRFYGLFQRIEKKVRKLILEHHNYIELDYDNFIFNCFYIKETGKKYKGDIYTDILKNLSSIKEHPQFFKFYRKLIKQISIVTVNSKNVTKAIQSINKILIDNSCHDHQVNSKYINFYDNYNVPEDVPLFRFNAKEIIDTIDLVHEPIKNYLYQCNSNWTQNIESNIMKKILELGCSEKFLAFSIHDAVIIPIEKKVEVIDFMDRQLLNSLIPSKLSNISTKTYFNTLKFIYINTSLYYINIYKFKYYYINSLTQGLTSFLKYRLSYKRRSLLEGH